MAHGKIETVAIVGAGISGVVSAAHLLRYGLNVVVFERSGGPGGVWRFDKRAARESSYPSEIPSVGDYVSHNDQENSCGTEDEGYSSDIEILHAPPGPCYLGLMNNVSTPLMRTSLEAWPAGIGDFVNHQLLEDYIVSISRAHKLELITHYNTRVEEVKRVGESWVLRTSNLTQVSAASRRRSLVSKHWEVDAVVVASGHYNAPRIPHIEGLQEWKRRWPERVQHSKGYRTPDKFRDKNVLLIGAGVSSTDIARELGPVARTVYQSSRGGDLDLPSSFLPPNAVRIGGVVKFDHSSAITTTLHDLTPSDPIPGTITLGTGSQLCNIHHVILCTGYMTSYPFLKQYHDDTIPAAQATPEMLVTAEGAQVHNLHKDIFYIPDPTLAFIGAPYHTATFSLFEFQAMALARVFAGTCRLPNERAMRAEYEAKTRRKGLGRDFHSLRAYGEEEAYVTELVEWVNRDASFYGTEPMRGHSEEWHAANEAREERLRWLRERRSEKDHRLPEPGTDDVQSWLLPPPGSC